DEPSVTSVDEPTRVIEAPVMWPLAPAVADATLRRTPPDPLLTGWLDGCAVDDESFARLKLYTWTTAERIDELRSDRLLLAHGRMPGEMSRFDAEITGDPYPLAARLRTTRRGRRYAWVSPWPTRMGWEGHDYGEHLVEITLREDAWFARFAPGTPERWRVLDENGRVVPEAEVRQNIGRIAAVYHVASGDNAYREIIVVDERHVDRWAFATPALRDRLRQDAAQLRALAARFERARPTIPEDQAAWLRAGWSRRPADDADLVERYRSCLALGSPLYRPTPERLRGMAAAMEATPSVAPLEHTVRRDRTWGVVMSTRTMCDETTACWETWQRAGTLSIRTR
ncbi:MAG: hypothetical protein KC619_22630, partial [Myxococcales bacterium]|nr:hypothetical protein [Myxococcales bacterium]